MASLLCVTRAALSSVLVEFRGRRSALELFVHVSWQARHFDSARSLLLWRGAHFGNAKRALGGSNCSRCGAERMLSAPGCRFRGKRVTLTQLRSLSLWRGAHFANAKRTLCALWVGQIALAVARRAFCEREANPLRTLGGSNRSRCGAVRILSMRSEPSAHWWVESLSLWRGAHCEHAN